MIPVALLLLLIGLDRLMVSNRWPRLDRTRRVWRRWTPRVVAYVRSAPGTYAYLFVLLITTWVLQTSSSTIANQLLLERSTNLRHLGRDPVRVIFSSAFWASSSLELFGWLALFTVFVAQTERWLGTARTAAVFFLGHVGATLLTALGLWAALHSDLVEASVVNAGGRRCELRLRSRCGRARLWAGASVAVALRSSRRRRCGNQPCVRSQLHQLGTPDRSRHRLRLLPACPAAASYCVRAGHVGSAARPVVEVLTFEGSF